MPLLSLHPSAGSLKLYLAAENECRHFGDLGHQVYGWNSCRVIRERADRYADGQPDDRIPATILERVL